MSCVWWNFECVIHLEFVPNGRAVDADLYSQQLERVHEILRRRYSALVNRKRVLLQQDNERPHTAGRTMRKFRNWEEWNCCHFQYTDLILCLQITICLYPWPIYCVEEISKTLKLWKWFFNEFVASKTRDWYLRGKTNLAERWLRT